MPKFKEKNTRKVFVEDMPAPTLDGKHKENTRKRVRGVSCLFRSVSFGRSSLECCFIVAL